MTKSPRNPNRTPAHDDELLSALDAIEAGTYDQVAADDATGEVEDRVVEPDDAAPSDPAVSAPTAGEPAAADDAPSDAPGSSPTRSDDPPPTAVDGAAAPALTESAQPSGIESSDDLAAELSSALKQVEALEESVGLTRAAKPQPPAGSAPAAPAGAAPEPAAADATSSREASSETPASGVSSPPATEAARPANEGGAAATPPAAMAVVGQPGKVQFKIKPRADAAPAPGGKTPAPLSPSARVEKATLASATASAPARLSMPTTRVWKRIYRVSDALMDAVNFPLSWASESMRAAIGYAALASIVVSSAWLLLTPIVLPQRDAITYLQERRAALDAPPPEEDGHGGQPADAHGGGDGHGGGGSHGGGH